MHHDRWTWQCEVAIPSEAGAGERLLEEILEQLDYERLDSDPEWLAYAAQFHGHLGPWATAGTRQGMAGVREILVVTRQENAGRAEK